MIDQGRCSMKKILFALKDMNVGGVEKALLSLLNEMDRQEYKITVLLLKNSGGFLKDIPADVEVKILDQYQEIESVVNNPPLLEIKKLCREKKIIAALKLFIGYVWYKVSGSMILYYRTAFSKVPQLIEEYDVAVSFTSIISYLTYFVRYKVKAPIKIGWIHFDVNKLNVDKKTIFNLHKDMKKIYIVSKESYENFVAMFPKLKDKCEVKYNIVSKKYISQMAKEEIGDAAFDCKDNEVKIITLGRLSKEKGQDIIPEVALRLKQAGINFKWYLIGEGNLRSELEKDICEKGLVENVILLGVKTNPYPYLAKSDIYVQTSVYEANSIALEEAKVLNLPIVATDFSGVSEQICNQKTGSIVKRKATDIYEELCMLIENPEKRKFYTSNLKNEEK